MEKSISSSWINFYNENILKGFQNLSENPFTLFTTILDILIVLFLLYCFVKMVKGSRAWQLIKGIALLVIATWISRIIQFKNIKFNFNRYNELGSNCNNCNIPTRAKKRT